MRIPNRVLSTRGTAAPSAIAAQAGDVSVYEDAPKPSHVARPRGYPAVAGLLLIALSFYGYFLGYEKGFTAGATEMKALCESQMPALGEAIQRLSAGNWTNAQPQASELIAARIDLSDSEARQDR